MFSKRQCRQCFLYVFILMALHERVLGGGTILKLNTSEVSWTFAVEVCAENDQLLLQLDARDCSPLDQFAVNTSTKIWVGEYYQDTTTWNTLSALQKLPTHAVEKCGMLSVDLGFTEDRCDQTYSYLCIWNSGIYASVRKVDWLTAAKECADFGFYLADQNTIEGSNFQQTDNMWIGQYKTWSNVQDSIPASTPARCLACDKQETGWTLFIDAVCSSERMFACEEVIQSTQSTTGATDKMTENSSVSTTQTTEESIRMTVSTPITPTLDDKEQTIDASNASNDTLLYVGLGVEAFVIVLLVFVLCGYIRYMSKKLHRCEKVSFSYKPDPDSSNTGNVEYEDVS